MGCTAGTAAAHGNSFHASFTLADRITEGTFGQVCACVERRTNRELAVKVVPNVKEEERVKAMQEHAVWDQIGEHELVVSLMAFFYDGPLVFFVMERCGRSLHKSLMEKPQTECNLLDILRQILLGLQHCHKLGVVHRDVKCDNVVQTLDGAIMKICDFGLAAVMPAEGFLIGKPVGTVPYMSPEIVQGQAYGFNVDVWSCGVIAYILCFGEYPYQPRTGTEATANVERKMMMHAIATDTPRPKYASAVSSLQPSESTLNFVKALLQSSSEQRPSADICLQLDAMRLASNCESGSINASCPTVDGDEGNVFYSSKLDRILEVSTAASSSCENPLGLPIALGNLQRVVSL